MAKKPEEAKPQEEAKSQEPKSKESKPKEGKPKEAKPKEPQEDLLTSTAKAIGKAAGKIASIATPPEHTPAPVHKRAKVPKLQKKNNPHLPRKMKKAQKKAAAQSRA